MNENTPPRGDVTRAAAPMTIGGVIHRWAITAYISRATGLPHVSYRVACGTRARTSRGCSQLGSPQGASSGVLPGSPIWDRPVTCTKCLAICGA